ncbi:MAG: DNA recombination/repair protein RecA, partial [Deltaproteobacteria bacterium]|nr:DNA recombination/repair protein RecA [Deltaproteobacteria bacterium]
GLGVHRAGDLLEAALKTGDVTKAGAWMSLDGERIGQGRVQAAAWLEEHPERMAALRAAVLARPVDAVPAAPEAEAAEAV